MIEFLEFDEFRIDAIEFAIEYLIKFAKKRSERLFVYWFRSSFQWSLQVFAKLNERQRDWLNDCVLNWQSSKINQLSLLHVWQLVKTNILLIDCCHDVEFVLLNSSFCVHDRRLIMLFWWFQVSTFWIAASLQHILENRHVH
jgi:hypothetical protein